MTYEHVEIIREVLKQDVTNMKLQVYLTGDQINIANKKRVVCSIVNFDSEYYSVNNMFIPVSIIKKIRMKLQECDEGKKIRLYHSKCQ